MFEISATRRFRASHALRRSGELVEEPHEHEWNCEVTLASARTDEIGTVADFRDVDRAIDAAIDPIAGRDLHSSPAFRELSPSAENVARFIYTRLKSSMGDKLMRVSIWEDPDHGATYYE
jgi:6-pyruvoyltetrahydropterin/6-carboxytetrahydropterin synthase